MNMMNPEETHPGLEFAFPTFSSPTPGSSSTGTPMLDYGAERDGRETREGSGEPMTPLIGTGDDGVESQVMAVYERRRLAQLLAAKKKLRTFRERKAKKQVTGSIGVEPVEQTNGREQDARPPTEEVEAHQSAQEIPVPTFYAPPPNPIASTSTSTTHSRSYSHSRTRSKHLTPMDMTFFTLPSSTANQGISPTLCTTRTASTEGMLAGRRKREALRPIRVQERGTAFGSGGDGGVGLGLGLGLGLGMDLGEGGGIQPETFSMPLPAGAKEKGMSPVRGSPRSSEHKKRRSFNFKKTVPLHRHSGSADSLRKLGSGFGYGCRPPGSAMGSGHEEEEERGIRTAPARLEGALLVHGAERPGLGGLGEPFSIPSYGPRVEEEKTGKGDAGVEMPELEMPGLDFAISMEVDADQEEGMKPFSFPQRRTFGFPQTLIGTGDEQSVAVLPEVAVVPSTPAWEEFALPAFDSNSPGKASASASSPVPEQGAKKRFQGFKFGQPAPAPLDEPIKPSMPAFSFGKKLEPVMVVKPNTVSDEGPSSAMSMPSLPSTPTRKKRHSHTRSGSVSSYHAFMPSNTGIPVAPRSPGMLSIEPMPRSSSPSGRLSPTPSSPIEGFGVVSPVKAPGDIKLDREGALRTLEGARSGLASGSSSASNLTWPISGVDGLFGRDGRPLSASGLGVQGKRRSRKSLMMEKAQQESHEVQIPDLDSDEETLDVSSPNPFSSGPPSPRPLSGIISAPASTRDSFDRMFKAPPAATAPGFGLTLAPTMGASVEPHLNTLVEEEEPEEDEQEATTPKASIATSPPPTASLQLRPLRLGSMSFDSMSSAGRLADPEDSWSDSRNSMSFERDRSSSVGSNPLSPSSSTEVSMHRASSGTDESMRAGRRPRSWITRGKRASAVSLSGSIQTLNEVPESADLEDTLMTPQAADSRIVIPPGVRTRRRRSATAHSIALGSFENCEDVALLKEKLADAAMERMAMEQDIQDWRGRCGDLEKQLRNERQQSGVLRDRVRRLGDHLSQISSASHPSEPAILEVDTPSQMMASMRDQLFKLAQEVERERKAKIDALANVAGLQVRLEALAPSPPAEDSFEDGEHSLRSSLDMQRGFAFPRAAVATPSKEPQASKPSQQDDMSTYVFGLPAYPTTHEMGITAFPAGQLDFRTCCARCRGEVIEL